MVVARSMILSSSGQRGAMEGGRGRKQQGGVGNQHKEAKVKTKIPAFRWGEKIFTLCDQVLGWGVRKKEGCEIITIVRSELHTNRTQPQPTMPAPITPS